MEANQKANGRAMEANQKANGRAMEANQKANGRATVLAIGTANPVNSVDQATYPDFYFKVTKSEHMTELKGKFQRMCAKSMIKNRYLHLTEDIMIDNPSMCVYKEPSLNARHDIILEEIPKLAKEAATKAINEWGQPKSSITHLVFCSTCGVDSPGADFKLTKLLDLNPSVKRYMLYQLGCYGGGASLRLAKDLAENNKHARVLVVCCEITLPTFHGPSEARPDILLGQALFGDGAAALIVGTDPVAGVEKGWFEMVSVAQTIIPNSYDALKVRLREEGMDFNLEKNLGGIISANIEKVLEEEFGPLGISDYNSLFYIVHPGGAGILNKVEERLKLPAQKLLASREVLSQYGNMGSASVLFIMDKMRKNSAQYGHNTTGEGLEWGVLFGFGAGITVETVVLRSMIA